MAKLKKQAVVERLARHRREPPPLIPAVDPAGVVHLHGESVAVLLQRARLGLERDLIRVAADLKIRKVYLVAIEEGRFDDLPGATYAVGFVRAYADYLELDSDEIVQRFKDEVEGLDDRLQLVFPAPTPEGKVPGGALILISALLMALAYGGWYYLSSGETTLPSWVPEVPEYLQTSDVDPLAVPADEEAMFGGRLPAPEVTAATPALEGTPLEAAPPPMERQASPSQREMAATTTELVPESPIADAVSEPAVAAIAEPAPEPAAVEPAPEPAAAEPAPEPAAAEPAPEPAAAEPAPEPAAVEPAPEPAAVEPAPEPAAVEPAPEPGGTVTRLSDLAAAVAPTESTPGDEAPPLATREPRTEISPPDESVLASNTIPQAPSPEGLLPEVQAREPSVYGVENVSARIVLRAVLDSWVQVRDEEDTLLLTRVLQPGDTYRVPNQSGLTLLTGNAGGLAIEVDGAVVPFLGPVGAVRRDIPLDPERLRNGTATTP